MKDSEKMMKEQFKEDDRSLKEMKEELESLRKEKDEARLKIVARQNLFDKIQEGIQNAKDSSASPSKISAETVDRVLHWFNYNYILRFDPDRETRHLRKIDRKIRKLEHLIKGGELLNENQNENER